MNIDWWSILWEGLGSAVSVWLKAILANPIALLAILVLGALGVLIPAGRRRRRF